MAGFRIWSAQAVLSAAVLVLIVYGLLFAFARGPVDVPFLYGPG